MALNILGFALGVPERTVHVLTHHAKAALLGVDVNTPGKGATSAPAAMVAMFYGLRMHVEAVIAVAINIRAVLGLVRQGEEVVGMQQLARTRDALAKHAETALLGDCLGARHCDKAHVTIVKELP